MGYKFQRFSDYQDTGLPWVGQCPAHWSIRRMKYLMEERIEKGYADEQLLTASQNRGVIPKADYGSRTVEAQKDLHLLKLVEPGDYVISLRSFQGGIEYAHVRGIISPAYTVLQPKPGTRRGYYEHFFKSVAFINSMSLFVTGIREGQNIDYVQLSRAYMPVPPLDEQDAIGRFVRHLDSKVNRLIKAKRRLIELLNEQRLRAVESTVSHSNTDWIRLGNLLELVRRGIDRAQVDEFVPIGLFNRGRGIFKKPLTSGSDLGDSEFYFVKADDLVISGQFAWEGAVSVAGSDVDGTICSHRYYTLIPKSDSISVPYIQAILQTQFGALILNHHSRGGAGRNRPLNIRTLLKEKVPVPTRELLAEVDAQTLEIQRLAHKVNTEISLLQQYRTRLVADVVTGQLDVRHLDLSDVDAKLDGFMDDSPLEDELDETEDILEEV